MKKIFKTLWLTSLLLLTGISASAAITSGYYRIKSYNNKYLTENTTDHTLICSDMMNDNYSQVWYLSVSGTSVTFKNVLTDRYIQGQGTFSEQYSTGLNNQSFTFDDTENIYTFEYDSYNKGGLHCSNGNYVLEWYTSEEKSKWTIEAAEVDASALAAQQAAINEASTTDLLKVFTTTACTELKGSYSESDLTALPSTVQAMAAKIKNNTWATYTGWDKTEKTFRVADYKAYSSRDRWTSIIGLGYSFGRLTNPTGISVTAGDYIQVYVGTIPSGQTVKLEVAGQYQAAGTTYALHQGMNVLLMASSGNCFVQYEVDNTTSGNAPYTALSSYADVTVHIEGGTVNGYFDLTAGDDNDDWAKLQANLLTGTSVDIKTSNLLFHMNTDLVTAACPTKMVELLDEWDKILNMEHSLMGLEEFDGYWNNLLSVTDMTGQDYMHASDYGTYYQIETISSIMSYADMFAGGAIWGPAHENGHIFQKYINMVGNTEVSNNLFSNVAVFNNGHLTSRATNISTTFENMANNVFWNDRDIWERTHLYYQLYQFFHILGNKSDFYPELFKALRSDPMVHTGGIFTSATDDYLKFYKKCCSVSGYDLTEFFQAYGFFVIPTMTSYTLSGVTKDAYKITDYGDYYLTVTLAEIDAAKQSVADMNLPKANIIFIEDRITAPDATYEGATAGTKKTAFSNEYPIGQAGETGQYTDFGVACSAYSYNISSKGNVTMSGTGAVGFKLYDASGNLCALYNSYDFALPSGSYTSNGLATGYTIKAAAGNETDAVATFDTNIEVNEDVKDVTNIADNADDAVAQGTQITSASSLISGKSYLLYYSGSNNSGFVKAKASTFEALYNDDSPTQESVFKFISNGDETPTYKIKSNWRGTYFPVPTRSTTFTPTTEGSAGSWALNFQSNGNIAPSCSGYSINRSTLSGTTRVIHGWDSGTGAANQLKIYEITLSSTALAELTNKDIVVSSTAAETVQTGQWYVMFDRGANHGYLYENSSSHTLYNTSTAPSGYAPDNAKYLVRIVGEGGNYYIQTGFGNYLGEITHSTAVPTTALKEQLITINKIAHTDGHYYLASSTGTILDANTCNAGDATVVGWGTTVPTATGGNNDWAFYPVELVKSEFSITSDRIAVIQGNQVTGKGNTMQALLRIKATPFSDFQPTQFTINLSGAAQVDNVKVYSTTSDQIHFAGVTPTLLGTAASPSDGTVNIDVTASSIAAGTTLYYWITADVKSTATEWGTIDASLASISYTNAYKTANTLSDTELDLSAIGDPDGEMRIYKSQNTLWTSSKSNSKYYRIPALLKTGANTLLAFTDDRYAQTGDLGTRGSGTASRIDVLVKKSTDGGATWGSAVTVAAGDGSTAAGCGYGDAAVAQAANGDIVCLMAAGNKSYSSGMLHIGYTKSTDGGATWSSPIDIYGSGNLTNNHTFQSTFVSSGHGITQTIANAGRIVFPALGKISGTTNEYVIYSDDNGATWTFTENYGYTGADESKLLELNDGKLLMSIRTGGFNSSNVARGYNRTTYTNVENWGTQGTWSDLKANGCNSDLIYYSRNPSGTNDVMLHSVVKSYSEHRKDLRLYMSFDQGETWEEAFQLQPGWAAYSSMQVLDNGDLAILFEDGSIGNEDENDCFDINYVTISRELMDAKIVELNPLPATPDVKIADGSTAPSTYGNWTINSSSTWYQGGTSLVASGMAGLTMQSSYANAFNQANNIYEKYVLAVKVSATNATDVITLTAPNGYVIKSYQMKVRSYNSGKNYTLTSGSTTITTTHNDWTTFNISDIDTKSTSFSVTTAQDQTNYLCVYDFTVTLKRAVQYHLINASGNEIASEYVVFDSNNVEEEMPTNLKRAFCTYSYFSDLACTIPATAIGNKSDIYVLFTVDAPFKFSTIDNPKWYLVYSHEQNVDGDYYSYADGSTYKSAIAETENICANPAYWWAFIGNPYNVQLLNKQQDAYLSASTLTGSNGAVVLSAVTTNTETYPYNSFSLYGYSNGNVITSNPFSLILNDSKYAWVNGADKDYSYRTGSIIYHSGITFNNSFQLTNWRGANLMVREIPTNYNILLKSVSDASYATLYLPFDVTTDENTKAYYISGASDGAATLTEVGSEGRAIPANTAVVLINDADATNATFSVTSGLSSIVSTDANLLKGTLTSMTLDLGDTTPYYSLGRKDGQIGFYKFNSSGTTTITLGANKAYLDTTVPNGSSKGFVLSFDELDAIFGTKTDGGAKVERWYTLDGRRLTKKPTAPGIYINNGKKVLIQHW